MQPYPPAVVGGGDTPAARAKREPADTHAAFARARALLQEMTARLGSAELLEATHGQVEDYLTSAGRELNRQLLQDHLDLRAATEEHAEAVTGTDGVARRRAEKGRRRQLATTVGRVEVSRIAYRAPAVPALHHGPGVVV